MALNQIQQAIDLAALAEHLIRETGEVIMLADLYRLQGAITLKQENPAAAEQHLTRALEVAQGQGSKLLEFRSAIDLGKHFAEQNKIKQDQDLLAPLEHFFGQGPDTDDLKAARDLPRQSRVRNQ